MTDWHAVARGGTRWHACLTTFAREKGNSHRYTMLSHACHRVPRGNGGGIYPGGDGVQPVLPGQRLAPHGYATVHRRAPPCTAVHSAPPRNRNAY